QEINLTQLLIIMLAMIVAAGTFMVIITNIIVGNSIGALQSKQNNPVTVTAAPQNAGVVCTEPDTVEAKGSMAAAGEGTGTVPSNGIVKVAKLPFGNYSNSSSIITTSTNS